MTSKERVVELLNELPLSERQRDLYLRGLDIMAEEEAKSTADQLEKGLSQAPEALEAAKRLLKIRKDRS